MLKVLNNILCDLDPKVKVIGQKAGICDGVPSTSALAIYTSMTSSNSHLFHAAFNLQQMIYAFIKTKHHLAAF